MPLSCATCLTIVCVERASISASLAQQLVGEAMLQALGRELDRRQRVLDLVRQAACHLAPGGEALRLQQPRDVVEHHHEAGFRHRPSADPRISSTLRPSCELDLLLPALVAAGLHGLRPSAR